MLKIFLLKVKASVLASSLLFFQIELNAMISLSSVLLDSGIRKCQNFLVAKALTCRRLNGNALDNSVFGHIMH